MLPVLKMGAQASCKVKLQPSPRSFSVLSFRRASFVEQNNSMCQLSWLILPGRSCSSLNVSSPLIPAHPHPMLQPLFTLKENCLFCSQSSAEQKDLSDSGEEPRGEAEAPHHGTGHPESAGEHALEPPAPASASASTPEAQLLPFPRELAGVSPPPPSTPQPGGPSPDRPLSLRVPQIQILNHKQLMITEKVVMISVAPFNSCCQKVRKD